MTKGVQSLIDHHQEAREDSTDPYVFTVESVEIAEDQRSAIASVCLWDPVPVYEVKGAPDGSDVLFNSEKSSAKRKYTVFLELATWRVGETTVLSTVKGKNTCVSK
jgi:hypothetical protein